MTEESADFQSRLRFDKTAVITIATSTTVSAAVDLTGTSLVAILLPAAMTGVAVSFQASVNGTDFFIVKDGSGATVSITTAAAQYIPVPASITNSIRYIKLVSGSAEAANRTIQLITKGT